MLDFNWDGGGITIYWPSGNAGTVYPPGSTVPVYQQQTQISNGMLLLIGFGLYLLLRK